MTTTFFSAENGGNAVTSPIYEIVTALVVDFLSLVNLRFGGLRVRPFGSIGRHAGESVSHLQGPVPFHQSGKLHR